MEVEADFLLDDDRDELFEAKMYVQVVNAVPDGCVWGLCGTWPELWTNYNGEWNKLTPYLIEMQREVGFYIPDTYLLLIQDSKEIISMLFNKYPNAVNYFVHSVFFKGDKIYAETVDHNLHMSISKEIFVDITGNEDWVDVDL